MPRTKAYKVIGLERSALPRRLRLDDEEGIEVDIPDEIDGEEVTGIADGAFADEDVTSVVLPDGLEDIGSGIVTYSEDFEFNEYENGLYIGSSENPYLSLAKLADTTVNEFHVHPDCEFLMHGCFENCESLTDLYFGEHIRQIANVFLADIYTWPSLVPLCFHLTSLTAYCAIDMARFYIPRPISYFVDGVHLEELVIPEGITRIGDNAFYYGDFSSVILPEGLREVGYQSFSRCENLTHVQFPSTLERLDTLSFAYNALESLDLPSSLKVIPFGAFQYNNLTSLCLPEGIEVIEGSAFSTNHLTSVEFPESLREIGRCAFEFNDTFDKIVLPSNLKFFNSDTFSRSEVTYNQWGDAYYLGTASNPYEVLVSFNFGTWGDTLLESDITSVSLHPDCKHLASTAFEMSSIEEVELNEGLKSIGWAAFLRCENLRKINIPSSVTYFGDAIFQGDSLLRDITASVNDGEGIKVKYLGNDDNPYLYLLEATTTGPCPAFTTRPETRAIASWAFLHCNHIGTLRVTGNVTCVEEDAISYVDMDELIFEEGVEAIGDIFNCSSFTSLTLPSTCTSFGGCDRCKDLVEVNLSENLLELGEFNTCYSLRNIIVPESVKKVGLLAYNCPSLELIYIPESTRVEGTLYALEVGKDEEMAAIVRECVICFEAASTPNDFSTYFWTDLDNVVVLWGFSFEEESEEEPSDTSLPEDLSSEEASSDTEETIPVEESRVDETEEYSEIDTED